MLDPEEKVTLREVFRALLRVLEDLHEALRKYLAESPSVIHLTIQGVTMSDYQLNQGDTVVVTITDTDEVTGNVVTPDPGSVSASISPNASSSTVVVDPSGAFATVTAGPSESVGDVLTVTATVGGVASTPASGSFDVVAAPPPDATALSLSFGTEASSATSSGTLPEAVTLADGTVLEAGSPLPAGTEFLETGELINTSDRSIYTGPLSTAVL